MRLSGQFQSCLLFFYEKILRTLKHSQANFNQENKIKQKLNSESCMFCVFVLFVCAKHFRRKKINRVEIVVIGFTIFYYTTSNFTEKERHHLLTEIQDGSFRCCSQMGEWGQIELLTKICHISYSDKNWQLYLT